MLVRRSNRVSHPEHTSRMPVARIVARSTSGHTSASFRSVEGVSPLYPHAAKISAIEPHARRRDAGQSVIHVGVCYSEGIKLKYYRIWQYAEYLNLVLFSQSDCCGCVKYGKKGQNSNLPQAQKCGWFSRMRPNPSHQTPSQNDGKNRVGKRGKTHVKGGIAARARRLSHSDTMQGAVILRLNPSDAIRNRTLPNVHTTS